MPRVERKMKGGAEDTVTIGEQEYKISSDEVDGATRICVSVPKPKATEASEPAPAPHATLDGNAIDAALDDDEDWSELGDDDLRTATHSVISQQHGTPLALSPPARQASSPVGSPLALSPPGGQVVSKPPPALPSSWGAGSASSGGRPPPQAVK